MRICIFSVILGFISSLFAQTIENVDFYVESQRIVVRYDLIYPTPDTLFNVSLDFRNDKGDKITPVSVTGDLNKVKPGVGKRIFWDALKDQVVLSGKYQVVCYDLIYNFLQFDDLIYEDGNNENFSIPLVTVSPKNSTEVGGIIWMNDNIKLKCFRNGDSIPQAQSKADWCLANKLKQPAWCYLNFDENHPELNEVLYNMYAIVDKRGLAPKEWHIPNGIEWKSLFFQFHRNQKSDDFFSTVEGFRLENGDFIKGEKLNRWWGINQTIYRGFDSIIAFIAVYSDGVFNTTGTFENIGLPVKCCWNYELFGASEDTFVKNQFQELEGIRLGTYPEPINTFVEEEADFPGGFAEMAKFLNDNIDYPQEAIDLGIKGRVTVRFVVEKDGRISNVSVATPSPGCKACDNAAVKLIEKMPPWLPAKNRGREVPTWVTLPIKFGYN
jgi:TonB family protein